MAIISVRTSGGSDWQDFSPFALTWGLQDVSDPDSGRDQSGLMHKNRVVQKVKLGLIWQGVESEEASRILKAFNPEYVDITYHDAMAGALVTRTFYVGDRSAPVWVWNNGNGKIYEQITFNVIER